MTKFNYLVKNNQTGFNKKYKYLKNARTDTGMTLNQIYKKSQGGLVSMFSEWEIIRLHPIVHYEVDSEDANHADDVLLVREEEQGHVDDDDDDIIAVTAMDVLDLAHRALDILEKFNI